MMIEKLKARPDRKLALGVCLSLLLPAAAASLESAVYYVDPATGSMGNPGTSASPWSTLQEVFAANKTFAPGDEILLRNGLHGAPIVKGHNAGVVIIRPDTGAAPKLTKLNVKSGSNWDIAGLDICPENAGAGNYSTANLVTLEMTCSYITVRDCTLRGVFSIAGYTETEWGHIGKGFQVEGHHNSLIDNHLENVGFAITVRQEAVFTLVSGNFIKAFSYDAIRGLANDCIYENNWVQDSYLKNSNHDDFFQSWSTSGTVYRVILRGNTFISRTDPNQPLYSPPQGIGCFDGFYEDWVVENNLVCSQTYHGISLYGAINCKVVNNTVVNNPYPWSGASGSPWIYFTNHKNGTPGTGNLGRNNITTNGMRMGTQGVADHNLNVATTAYATYFNDHLNFDYRLISTAPAVGAGSATDAPATDITGAPRSLPYDIGAFEYQPIIYEGFDYAPTTSVNTAPDSPSDCGLLGATWTGSNDIVTPGLSYTGMPGLGNALKFFSNVPSSRVIDMSALPPGYTVIGSDSVERLGKTGTTLWFMFLIRADAGDSAGTLEAGLHLNGEVTGGTTKLKIGDVSTSPNWGIEKNSTSAHSSTPITVGETVLLVARVSFVAGSSNDEVDLFVNPPLAATPPAVPSAMLRNMDVGSFETVQFKGNRTCTVDELAIATAWEEL